MKAPFFAGLARMAIATLGGWLAVEKFGLGLDGVFTAIAVGIITFGSLIAGPLLVKPWGPKVQRSRARLSPRTGGSHAASLDDRNLEPQPR
jgi:hypothetical protein